MTRIYNILIFALLFSALHGQSIADLSKATVTGLAVGDGEHTFHFYTLDGKLWRGYSEVFIALTDKDGAFVEDFTVDNFKPLMDMGMSKHSTPVGKVEKVAHKPLYKTWFAFLMYTGQMDGSWALDFDYSIGSKPGKIAGATPQVENYPANSKWIQSFTYKGESYYLTVVSPLSLKKGSQTLQAYINKQENVLQPYPVVEGGFKIEITPWMTAMGHGSHGNAPLVWNTGQSVYEGTLNLGMEGDWRIYLKVLDAVADTLVAGDEGVESSLYWDIVLNSTPDGIVELPGETVNAKVYPTLSRGEIIVTTASKATVKIVDIHGKTFASHAVEAGNAYSIFLNYPDGLYIVLVENEKGKTSTHKVFLKR